MAHRRQWTSADVITGVDVAVKMGRTDLRPALSSALGKRLVVYGHRPRDRSHFNGVTELQVRQSAQFAAPLAWLCVYQGIALIIDAYPRAKALPTTKLLYLILNRSKKESRMPSRERSMTKAQFAVLFGERFIKAMAA